MTTDEAEATCYNCGHDELDHILDPMTKIAWCYWCHDEYLPFDVGFAKAAEKATANR